MPAHSLQTAPELSIILPTYNERENIAIFIPDILRVFKDVPHEVLIVDDSSTDGTVDEVRELQKKYSGVRLISREKKDGIGSALRFGYSQARGQAILSSDCDLSFTADDLRRLYDELRKGYDFVVGSRHSRGSHYETPNLKIRLKYAASCAGNAFLTRIFKIPVSDFSANCRVLRRTLWQTMATREDTNFFLFETILLAKERGARIAEIPVTFFDRRYGSSKINHMVEIPKAFWKMLVFISRRRFFS